VTARWLVTGAAGFIGSHVSEALVARGDAVVGVDNFDPYYARSVKESNLAGLRASPRFRFVEGDCLRDSIPLDGVDALLHLAARPGVRPSLDDPVGVITANVTATTRLLEAAHQAGVRRIVFASSSSVYGDSTPAPFSEDAPALEPISPYAASKRAAELVGAAFAHLYGQRIACLRFFTVYGPRQRPDLAIHRFTALLARGETIRMYGDGSAARDYTYIADAVRGVLAALDWTLGTPPGVCRPFNIGGGDRVRLDRLIAVIAGTLGVTPRIERAPDQPGDVRFTDADLTRSTAELGYRPSVGIEAGIREFVRWYEATHGRQS
jgi:UDP-glucuronate 4-epimerase